MSAPVIDRPFVVTYLGWNGVVPATFHETLEEARRKAEDHCSENGGRYLVSEAVGVVGTVKNDPVWEERPRTLEIKVSTSDEHVEKVVQQYTPEKSAAPKAAPPRSQALDFGDQQPKPVPVPGTFASVQPVQPAPDANAPPWTPRPLPEGDGKPRYAEVRGVKLPPDVLRRTEDVGVGLGTPAPELLREVEEMFVAAHSNIAKTIMTWTGYPLTDVNHATLVAVKDVLANFIKK
jgi:hypothetical protein